MSTSAEEIRQRLADTRAAIVSVGAGSVEVDAVDDLVAVAIDDLTPSRAIAAMAALGDDRRQADRVLEYGL
ncbi:hypothetical protein [Herbiconiux sp. L3-i23]|uniref:hypothetical protein n=1 Tax=Herbiconiux sp. L3-i23 TaxID=2905871 RepID=UPI002056B839|nr:hypothetical protein [Herbiconiux sp. L3-i23]BDI21709.1 hypothetical protein L3i23_04850 [Herbiconiux sp. L3-i23]